jgi:hypothetical protein
MSSMLIEIFIFHIYIYFIIILIFIKWNFILKFIKVLNNEIQFIKSQFIQSEPKSCNPSKKCEQLFPQIQLFSIILTCLQLLYEYDFFKYEYDFLNIYIGKSVCIFPFIEKKVISQSCLFF